jgi:DNA invertase Pin-like site-specific DNA recombinase
MVTEKLKELEAARAKLASLEQSIAAERQAELAALPAKLGYASAADFLSAFKAATGATGAAGAKRGRKAGKAKAAGKSGRKARVPITDEIRAQVKKLVDAGKSGAEIAKAVGISLPSVQNVKKALGLVKKR